MPVDGFAWIANRAVPQRMTSDQQILLDQLIATTSGTDAKEPEERLRWWNQAVRTWKEGGVGRD